MTRVFRMTLGRKLAPALALALLPAIAPALEINLAPVADSTVDALDPDAVNNLGVLLATKVGANNLPAEQLKFFYAQYQLPDGMTGRDVGSVSSADLRISRGDGSITLGLTYYIYGVFDGVDSESADNYTWNDGVGFNPENTEVRFLGTDEISYYQDPAESAYVGYISVDSAGNPNKSFGILDVPQGETAIANFQNLIRNDRDGRLTFYFAVRQNFGVTPLQNFASIEDETRQPPTLIFSYEPAPDAIPGDYNGDGVVDAADYTVWRDTLGSTEDLRANGDDTGISTGIIDGADYLVWSSRFGDVAGATVASVGVGVPEPASVATCVVLLGSIAFGRLRSRVVPK